MELNFNEMLSETETQDAGDFSCLCRTCKCLGGGISPDSEDAEQDAE